jgi:PAS domain S-box-containing protein
MTATDDPIHLLLVEDDYEDYLITRDLLLASSFDYQIEWARDYESGKLALERMAHDICLIDYHLGNRDGIELISEIQALSSPTPMILLTGEQDTELGLRASAAGASDFLSKNEVTPRKLDRSIRYSLEREKAAQRKRHNRELLSAALNAITGHIGILDENGIVIAVNADWQRMAQTGMAFATPEPGRNFLEVCFEGAESITGESVRVDTVIREVISGEIAEGRIQYPLGSAGDRRWFAMRVTRFFEERSLRIMLFNTDITERKKIEDAARRLAAIVEHSADAIVSLDQDGRVTSWNHAAETLFGHREEQILGAPVASLELSDSRESVSGILARVLTGEAVALSETEMLSENGRRLTVSCVCSPVYSASGQITGVSGIIRDISHQKNLEQQLLHSQRLDAIGQLTGGIAHDFNNILTVINGNAETLKRSARPEHPGYREITQIADAGQRAAKLTQQLLAFGRKQTFRLEVVDLNEIVLQLRPILESLIRGDIGLNFNLNPQPLPVKVDVSRMGQVLVNLVINARDAMPAGGTIGIGTWTAAAEAEMASAGIAGPCANLSVSDTGIGIPAEIREKIFEPFFTTKESGKGTGLGLSTVYGIVKQSGGMISLESEVGRGTTFTVALPACAETALETTPEPGIAETASQPRSARILLVEADENVREYGAGILLEEGHTVYEAANGDEACAVAETTGYAIDLLIADSSVRGSGRRSVADELLERIPGLRILYVSGYSGESISTGPGRDILEKPFTPRALRLQVESILRSSAGSSSGSSAAA